MKKFKIIEDGRLNESSMAKIVGGRPCTNNDCGDPTGYSCNSAYGYPECPSYYQPCPGIYLGPCAPTNAPVIAVVEIDAGKMNYNHIIYNG